MKLLHTLLIFLFLNTTFPAFTNEDAKIESIPKVLVLIVASDDQPVYIEEQKIWRSYMHLDREHFEAYFIKANPELQTDYEISYDVISSKVESTIFMGMVQRNLLSLEAMMPRMEEFDYVLRTNLSSFYAFPKLLNFIKTLPKDNCYCGVIIHDPYYGFPSFVSGAGIIISRDLVKRMVADKALILDNCPFAEDVVIGKYFYERQIAPIPASRIDLLNLNDWMILRDSLPEDAYHFRTKNNDPNKRLTEEIFIQSELVNKFYPNPKN